MDDPAEGTNEGESLEINSRAEFAKHIQRTMDSQTAVVTEARGTIVLYGDKSTGTIVVHNPALVDQGTCFRPHCGVDTYVRNKIAVARLLLGREPLVVTGGHNAFYDAKELRDSVVEGVAPSA